MHAASAEQCRPASCPRPIGELCKTWDTAWRSLTLSIDILNSNNDDREASHQLASFCQRMWALVDLPSTGSTSITLEHAKACILDIVKKAPLPHLPLSDGEFRLLRLESTDENRAIRISVIKRWIDESGRKFSTLSYCWGPPDQAQKIIIVNGTPTVVHETLHSILSQCDGLSSGYHWIDALCINQNDPEDKNMQIPQTDRIYSQARWVNIWLGPDRDDLGYALGRMCELAVGDMDMSSRFINGLSLLLSQPWSQRLWVVQELVLARSDAAVLWSGDSRCLWNDFVAFFDRIWGLCLHRREQWLRSPSRIDLLVLYSVLVDSPIKSLIEQRNTYLQRPNDFLISPLSLGYLIYLNRQRQCTNPRDKTYGLLGMSSAILIGDQCVDYRKSVSQVYLDTTICIMQGSANSSCIVSSMMYGFPVLAVGETFDPDPPSWAFDFSYSHSQWAYHLRDRNAPSSKYPKSSSSSQFRCDLRNRELELNVSLVDEIAYVLEVPKFQERDDWKTITITELEPQTKAEIVRFLAKADYAYRSRDGVAAPWMQGNRKPILDLILALPLTHLDRNKNPDKFLKMRPEMLGKYEALVLDAAHLINEWDQTEAVALYQKAEPLSSVLANALNQLSNKSQYFFITTHNLCGFCMPGAQIGDTVSVFLRDQPDCPNVPFVIRPRGDGRYSMICVAWLQREWEGLSKYQETEEPRTLIFR